MSKSALLLHQNSSKESTKSSIQTYRRTRLLPAFLFTSCVVLLLLVQNASSVCVWEGNGGFKLACGFRQSGLFRIRSLGGLKGWAGAGFTIGDEDGFKDSLTNADVRKQHLTRQQQQRLQQQQQQQLQQQQHQQQMLLQQQNQQQQQGLFNFANQPSQFKIFGLGSNMHEQKSPPDAPKIDQQMTIPQTPGQQSEVNRNGLQKRSSYWKWPLNLFPRGRGPQSPHSHHKQGLPMPVPMPMPGPSQMTMLQRPIQPPRNPLRGKSPLQMFAPKQKHPSNRNPHFRQPQQQQPAQYSYGMNTAQMVNPQVNFQHHHPPQSQQHQPHRQGIPYFPMPSPNEPVTIPGMNEARPYGLKLLEGSQNYGTKFLVGQMPSGSQDEGINAGVEEVEEIQDVTAGYDTNVFPDIYFTTTTPKDKLTPLQKQLLESELLKLEHPGTKNKIKLKKVRVIKHRGKQESKKGRKKVTPANSQEPSEESASSSQETTTKKPKQSKITTTEVTTAASLPTTSTVQITKHSPDFSQNMYYKPHDSSSVFTPHQPNLSPEDERIRAIKILQSFGFSPPTSPTTTTTTTSLPPVRNPLSPLLTSGYDPRYPPDHPVNREILRSLTTTTTTTPRTFFSHNNFYDPRNHFTKKLEGSADANPFPNPQLGRDHQSFVALDSKEASSRINLTKSYNDQFYNHYNKTSITTFGIKPKVSDIYWIHAATESNKDKDFPIKPIKSNTWTNIESPGDDSRFTTTVSSVMSIDQSTAVPSESLDPYRPKLVDLSNSESESTESSRFPQWNSINTWQGFKKHDRFGTPVDFVTNDNFKSSTSDLENNSLPSTTTTESTTTHSTTMESPTETEAPPTRRPSRRRYRTSTTPAPTTEGEPSVKRHKHHRKRYKIRTFPTTTPTTPTPTTTASTEKPQMITSMDASYSWSGGDGFKHDLVDPAPIRSTSENSITPHNENQGQASEDGFIPPISSELQERPSIQDEDRLDTLGNSITQETPGEELDYNRQEEQYPGNYQPVQSQPPREQFQNYSPEPQSRPRPSQQQVQGGVEEEEEAEEEEDQAEAGNVNGFMPTTGSSISKLLKQVDSLREESSYPNFPNPPPHSIVPEPSNGQVLQEQLLLVPQGETMEEEKEEEETSYDEPQEEDNSQQPRPFPKEETKPTYTDEITPSTYRPTYHRSRPQQQGHTQHEDESEEEEDELIPPILPENRQKNKPAFLQPQSEMMAPPPGTNFDQTYTYNHDNNFQQNQPPPPHLHQSQNQQVQNHHYQQHPQQQQQLQQQQSYHFTTLGHAENSPLPKQNLAPPPLPAVDEYNVRQQADPLNETSSSLPSQNFFPPPPSHYQIYGAYQDPNQILKEKPKPAFRFPSIPLATLNPFAAFQKPQKVKQDQFYQQQQQGAHSFGSTIRPGPQDHPSMIHQGQRPQFQQGPPQIHPPHHQLPHIHQPQHHQPQHFNPHQYQQQAHLNPYQQQQGNLNAQQNWATPQQAHNHQATLPKPFKPSPPAPPPQQMTDKPLTEKESVLKALETLSKVKTDVIQSIVHEKLGGTKKQSPTPQSPSLSQPVSISSPVLPSRPAQPQRNQDSVSLSTDAISSLFSSKADHGEEGEAPSIQDQIKELMKLKQAKEILMKQKLQEQQDHQSYMKVLQKQQEQLQQQQQKQKQQQALLSKLPQAAQSPDLQTKLKLAAILQQPGRNYSATQLETIKKILALNHIEESLKTPQRPNPSHAPPAGRDALNVITPPSPNTLSAIQLEVLKHRLSQSANRGQQIPSNVLQHKSDELDQAPNQLSSGYPTAPSGGSNVENLRNAFASVPTILALKALALKKAQAIRPTPQVVLPQQVKPQEENAQHTQAIDLSAILASPSPIQMNFPKENYSKWSNRAPLTDVKNAPKSFYPGDNVLKFDTNSTLYTDFQCDDQKHFPGLYADPALSCKVFHLCAKTDKGYMRKSFRCPEETVFDQEVLRCNWNLYVECSAAESKYHFNKYLSESFQFLRVLGEFSSSYKARNPSESKT